MPSSATITSYYSFSPLTKIKSAEVNSNFDTYRGHIVPVEVGTATAADSFLYDLGSDDHAWRDIYSKGINIFADTVSSTPPAGFYGISVKSSSGKAYIKNSSGVETELGSGSQSGAKNLIDDGGGENGYSNFIEGYYSAATRPSGAFTQTSGAGSFSISTTSTDPLFELNSLVLTKTTGSSQQGRAIERTITLDKGYRTKVLQLEIDYQIVSGTFVAGSNSTDSSLIWYMSEYNGSAWSMKEPSSFKMLSNSTTSPDKLIGNFQVNSDTTQIKLIAYVAESASSAWVVKCEVAIKPCSYVYGTPITDWTSFTPTGAWTGGNVTYTGFSRRVGDTEEYDVKVLLSGPPSGTANFHLNLRPGRTVDTAKLSYADINRTTFGVANILDSGISSPLGVVVYNNTTSVAIQPHTVDTLSTGFVRQTGTLSSTSPFTFNTDDAIQMRFSLPILGWSSSVQQSDGYDGREIVVQVHRGTSGQVINSASPTKLQFNTKVKDSTNSFDATTDYRFTAPSSGDYNFKGMLAFAAVATSSVIAAVLYKNGGALKTLAFATTSTTGNISIQFDSTDTAIAGDYYEIYLDSNSIAVTLYSGASIFGGSQLSIEKLASPQTISATETVAAVYKRSTVQTITTGSFQVCNLDTVEIDTHGAVTTGASWKFTAPIAGIYEIAGFIEFAAGAGWDVGEELALDYFKNGSAFARGGGQISQTTHGTYTAVSGAPRMVSLNAGDYIDMRIYQSSGASRDTIGSSSNLYWISIKKIK
jgi:hypothetical protein